MKASNARLRAGLYLRRSDDNAQEHSIERQQMTVPAYAKKQNYTVAMTEVDDCPGDEWEKRIGLQKILSAARNGDIDVIVCDELKRLSRQDFAEFMALIVFPCQQAGVFVDTVEKGIVEWSEVIHFIMLAIEQEKSTAEVRTLSRRVVTGMLKAAQKGCSLARSPYGYSRAPGKHKPLCPVYPQADAMKEMFRRVAADETLWSIADDFNRRGVPPPAKSPWCASSMAEMVRNRAYIGESSWGKEAHGKYFRPGNDAAVGRKFGKSPTPPKQRHKRKEAVPPSEWSVVPNAHEALVSQALFDAANAALDRRSPRNGPAPWKSPNPEAYLLSGLLECGNCGYALTGISRAARKHVCCPCGYKGVLSLRPGVTERPCPKCKKPMAVPEGWEVPSKYICSGARHIGPKVCKNHTIEETDLLHLIGSDIAALFGNPESRRAEIIQTLAAEAEGNPVRLAECKAALVKVRADLKVAMRRFPQLPAILQGEAEAAMVAFKTEEGRLVEEIRTLEGNTVATGDIEALADGIVRHLGILHLHLIGGDRTLARKILQRFVERIRITFVKDGPALDIWQSMSVKYRQGAFTVRALLSESVALLAESVRELDGTVRQIG